MLVLFTIALVAGQARANLPNEIKAAPVPAETTSVSIILNADGLRKIEALTLVVDTLLALPTDLGVGADDGINSLFDGDEYSSRSKPE